MDSHLKNVSKKIQKPQQQEWSIKIVDGEVFVIPRDYDPLAEFHQLIGNINQRLKANFVFSSSVPNTAQAIAYEEANDQ